MPVTAKLSRKFYEAFGDDIANELVEWFNSVDTTYRSDLRELNELNYTRFDAKLEQRIAEVKAELRQEVAGLRTEMREGFARLEGKFAGLEGKFGGLEGKFGGLEGKFESRLEASLQELKSDLLKWMFGAWATLLGAMIALIKLG
jgi:predicted nuclease with TOPRIM domain